MPSCARARSAQVAPRRPAGAFLFPDIAMTPKVLQKLRERAVEHSTPIPAGVAPSPRPAPVATPLVAGRLS
ncbi:hypothetical protein [Caulobacter sp. 1776]|uniref:hypothetical protein n=1 Tax=Caulobacter sp. 1776 TaxID=3156420 RepID=UPI00339A20A9